MKRINKILTLLLAIALIFGCVMSIINNHDAVKEVNNPKAQASTSTTEPAKKGTTTARLMCAGDNLIHLKIFEQAKAKSQNGGYDFSYTYQNVKDIISKSDIAFLNQETVITASNPASSFPLFNSPPELLDEMIGLGFNVFNQSTNHVMDKGVSGALEDYELFHSKENIILTGLYKTWDEMFIPQTMTRNDIIFSFVGFSQYLNGLTVPNDSDLGLVYLTDTRHTEEELYSTMQKMIDNAKKASDIVCVSMHWQQEDITTPNQSQREIVAKLVDMGADVIIGTGPHVLQPIEFIEKDDGSKVLVIWSLGNFISTQQNKNNTLGGIADVEITKNYDTGKTYVSNVGFIPTVGYYEYGRSNIRIIPFKDYSVELASRNGAGVPYSYVEKFFNDMFGDMLELS